MIKPQNALDNPARLEALKSLNLLDTNSEPGFDRLTRMVRQFIQVPVALVSLVDDQKQFFKAACGLSGPLAKSRSTRLSHSFCQHVVASAEPLIVPDAREHPLLRDNAAIPDYGVIAYLGFPIRTPDGYVIGSFCAIDNKPREWNITEVQIMAEFAELAGTEVAMRWNEAGHRRAVSAHATALVKASQLHQAVLDGTTYSIIGTTVDGMIQVFNAGAERILGYTAQEMVGVRSPIVIHLPDEIRARAVELSTQLGRTVGAGFDALVAQARVWRTDDREWTYVRKDGTRLIVLLSVTPLHDAEGAITGFLHVAQDLTERKKTEFALKASEERLHRVLSRADCLVWEAEVSLTDTDWAWRMTVHPSGLYRRLTGEGDSTTNAGLWYQFKIPQQDEMNRRSRQALESGAPGYDQEFQISRGGQTYWIRETVSITPNGPGRFWLVGVAIDATEQNRAQAARDEVVSRLNKLGSLLPGMIYQFRLRPDGTSCFPYASEGIRRLYDVTPEEVSLTADKVFERIHSDDVVKAVDAIQKSAQTQQPLVLEYRILSAEGDERWMLNNAVPEREVDGGTLWHGFVTDITDRKHAEKALLESQERFRQLADSAPIGIFQTDQQGRCTYTNSKWQELTGLTAEAAMGEGWVSAIHPDDIAGLFAAWKEAVDQMEDFIREFRFVREENDIRWISTNAAAVRDDRGRVLGYVGSCEDITDRIKTSEPAR